MNDPAALRAPLLSARRFVLKLGTRVLTHDDGTLALSRLFGLIESAVALRRAGKDVILVSSGAVGLGRDALGFSATPTDVADRQACAAVGQTRLMALYQDGFARLGVLTGQVLLSQSDFDDRVRCLNLRATLTRLLRRGVIPIVNENDAVSTEELAFLDDGSSRPVFGDNDKLSALVATELAADLLILLTDVEGVFDSDPRGNPAAQLLTRIDSLQELGGAGASTSGSGRGGMRSKVSAAQIAARSGCHAVIASGREPGVLARSAAAEPIGTWFPAREDSLQARRRWIAYATAPRGVLRLDAGAVEALVERGASLLAAGVKAIEGEFHDGDVVELRGPKAELIGRGLMCFDSGAARAWCAGTPPPGIRNHDALVHRRHLVLEPQ
ncbi:MAG: glutamate 5-kinase [Planctomycetes bacterium]|nr:glutamate 5-kinase [Planctomycetota bacterium]